MELMNVPLVEPTRFGPGVRDGFDDWQKWVCVYPHYLDSTRTQKYGRKVPQQFAVKHPRISEIEYACLSLGFRYVVEDKCHPRDALVRGRLRVDVVPAQDTDRQPTKLQILISLADNMATNRVLLESAVDCGPESSRSSLSKPAAKGVDSDPVAAIDNMVILPPPKPVKKLTTKSKSKKKSRAELNANKSSKPQQSRENQIEMIRTRYKQIASGLGMVDILDLVKDAPVSTAKKSTDGKKKNRK